jgi:2-polyprenyl-3-methyl-5-hydroxy-6-metoxy-1,4-benzoquinol methylase
MSTNNYKKRGLFVQEDLRHKYAQNNNQSEFIQTYKKISKKINNYNTSSFWNSKFTHPESLDNQDAMTKEKILKISNLLPDKKIKLLDLGIGQGYLEQKLKKDGSQYDVYGIDISPLAIRRAKHKYKGTFIIGDVLDVERFYKKNYFDYIVAIELIEHIYPYDVLGFYKKISNLLKPNGFFIISTPLNEGLRNMKNNPSEHVREYTPEILKMEFDLAGFKILNIDYLYAFKTYYVFKKILAKFLIHRWLPNNIIIKAQKK